MPLWKFWTSPCQYLFELAPRATSKLCRGRWVVDFLVTHSRIPHSDLTQCDGKVSMEAVSVHSPEWVNASAGGHAWVRSRWSVIGRQQWSGRFFGQNQRLRSSCLQVQPVTCWQPPAFLYWIGVYSINSSKIIGNSLAVSNFNRRLFLKLNRFICN
jgi:hypothetical protein